MIYIATYCALISKRLKDPISKENCYCETHHIIPKSEGGLNEKDNLVVLTAREHYIAHLLLWKIYKDYKMFNALQLMRVGHNGNRNIKFNSRLFSKTKEKGAKKISERMKGWAKRIGYQVSEETKEKLRKAATGKKHPYKKRIPCSQQTREKLKKGTTCKPVQQFSLTGELIAEYFSTKEAERQTGIRHVYRACNGTRKTSGGYVWKYKNN